MFHESLSFAEKNKRNFPITGILNTKYKEQHCYKISLNSTIKTKVALNIIKRIYVHIMNSPLKSAIIIILR